MTAELADAVDTDSARVYTRFIHSYEPGEESHGTRRQPARVLSAPRQRSPTSIARSSSDIANASRAQREYFSERAITDADQALARVLGQLEQLCAKDDADQLIARLLRKFNAVTGLSGWSDPTQLH